MAGAIYYAATTVLSAGAFAGGFYARLTRAGCDAIITAHPRRYLDYSIGTRCCLDPYVWPGARSQ